MRVLHLEDDLYVTKAVRRVLERDGHEVISVMGSREAIDSLRNGGIDFFLSDWAVVGGTSYPALKEAISLSVPLLVFSGSIQEVRDSGIDCLMLDKYSADLSKLREVIQVASGVVSS